MPLILTLLLTGVFMTLTQSTAEAAPTLQVSSVRFGVTPEEGSATRSKTEATVRAVHSPLKTTLTLLKSGDTQICLVATEFNLLTKYVSTLFRESIGKELGIPPSHVLLMWSHNHSVISVAENDAYIYEENQPDDPEPRLMPIGEKLLSTTLENVRQLPEKLEAVTVWWAEGHEGRITYNRKGRRADGSTYFMREQDRVLLGKDFNGDIDTEAPVVIFKNEAGEAVGGLVQFTGHPVTSYHPEHPVVFGEWCQVATDKLAEHLGGENPVPMGFLQGCAGDINSKEMFHGGVERATEFGEMLAESYIDALDALKPSTRPGIDFAVETVRIPLAPLPPVDVLEAEVTEMADFVRRADAGDEDTLACVGLNFPRDLSPKYRGRLIDLIRPWNDWALELHQEGKADSLRKHLKMEIAVLRIGDVGIVGIPCEPFMGIGRQIRAGSTLPMTIPCGYTNDGYGYITDGPNTGDREYMSAFYRYTRFRPPFEKPAGDAIADSAVAVLNGFAERE